MKIRLLFGLAKIGASFLTLCRESADYTNISTLPHEIGHYFNLYHTHQGRTNFLGLFNIVDSEKPGGNCGPTYGDELCDTPPDPNLSNKCVDEFCQYDCTEVFPAYNPDTRNMMSYSKSECRTFFSPGQINRMQTSLMMDRSYLLDTCEVVPTTQSVKNFICSKRDRPALIALYNATNGSNWTNPWNLNRPIDEWAGVTLKDGCVEKLILDSRNLNGNLPPEIGDLADLTSLILNTNNLTGSIPNEIGYLRKLTNINLQVNKLSGSIPRTIGTLTNLQYLVLNNNNLEGEIPEDLSRLTSLLRTPSLFSNQLSGCFSPFLSEFCSKPNSSNNFISNGNSFDSTWEQFCSNAQLGSCSKTSRMSDSLTLVKLYRSLNGPNWRSSIQWPLECPMDLWPGITLNIYGRVTGISVNSNSLNIENYTGSMIPEIGDLEFLRGLRFMNFNIYNALPSEILNLKNLLTIYLGSVSETTIPVGIENWKNLQSLTLLSNEKDDDGAYSKIGYIPSALGGLKNLKALRLRGFKGSLPKELATLPNLNTVNLCSNKLDGCFDPAFQNWCSIISDDTNKFCLDAYGNNNFNATFEEFCNTGRGTCSEVCQPEIDLETQILYGNQTHQSKQLTRSEGTFKKDALINLKSEEKISLFEGFKVESGGCLNAKIEPCEE